MLASIRTSHGSVGRNIRTAGTTTIAFDDHVPVYEEAIAAGDPDAARTPMATHAGRHPRLFGNHHMNPWVSSGRPSSVEGCGDVAGWDRPGYDERFERRDV
jgi:hypothetical protein